MNRAARAARGAGWLLMALSATAVGAVSLRYGLMDRATVPPELRASFDVRPLMFVAHALAASAALLIGPWQLLGGLRARRPGLHRALGRTYGAAVLVAGAAAVPMAVGSFAGPVAAVGFAALAGAWIYCTAAGVLAARGGRMEAHRRWMVRSVALTFAAVTLRLYLPIPPLLGWSYVEGYRVIAWACWLPNLLLAEAWLRRRPAPQRPRIAAMIGALARPDP
jgi:uncharacterized membrane protein